MEDIIRTIEEHKDALYRVLKPKFDHEKNTVIFGHKQCLKKTATLLLWIVVGISALFILMTLFDLTEKGAVVAFYIFSILALLGLILIRYFSYEIIINPAESTFEFKGQLRKNWIFTLADYEEAETRRTVKDFPEEFWVNFRTEKGTKSFKLADLNMGRACDIEPNHEAVCALWDAIIRQMQSNNSNPESNNNQEVAPDTD
jgi:hypothetical protein